MIKPPERLTIPDPPTEDPDHAATIANPRMQNARFDFSYFLGRLEELSEDDWGALLGSRGVLSARSPVDRKFLDELKEKLLSKATPKQHGQVELLVAELQNNLRVINERFIDVVDTHFRRLQAITSVHTDMSKLGTWHEISRQVLKQVLGRIVREYLQPMSATEATPNFWPRRAEQPDQLTGKETNEGDPGMRTERTSHYSMGSLEGGIVERWQSLSKVEQIADFIQAQLMATVTFQYESNQAGIKAAKKKKKRRANFHIPDRGSVRYLLIVDGKPYHLELPVVVSTRTVPAHRDIVSLIQHALQADPPAISAEEWQRLYDVSLIPDSKQQRKDPDVKALIGVGEEKVHFVISTGSQTDENGQENDPYDPALGVITFGKNTIAHFRLNTATPDAPVFSHVVGKASHSWFNGMPFRDYMDISRAELMMKGDVGDEQPTPAQRELALIGDFRAKVIALPPRTAEPRTQLRFRREFFQRQTLSDEKSQWLNIAWLQINQKFKDIGLSITPQDLISFSIAMNLRRNIHVVRAVSNDGTLLDVPMMAASSNWIQQFYESRYGKPLAEISDEERAKLIKDFIVMIRLFSQEKNDAEFCKSITAVFAELSGETFEKTTDLISGLLAPELRDMVTNRVGGMLSAFVDGKSTAVKARKRNMVLYLIDKQLGETAFDPVIVFNVLQTAVNDVVKDIQKKRNLPTITAALDFIQEPSRNSALEQSLLDTVVNKVVEKVKDKLSKSEESSSINGDVYAPIIKNILLQPLEDIEVTTANPFVYGNKARAKYLNNSPDPIGNTQQFGSTETLRFEQGGVFSLSKKQGEIEEEVFDLCVRMSPEQFNPDRLTEHIATVLVNQGVKQGKVVDNGQYTILRDQLLSELKKIPGFRQGLAKYLLALSDFSNPDGYRQQASQAILTIGKSWFSNAAPGLIGKIVEDKLGLKIGRQSLNEYIQEAMDQYAQEEVQLVFDGLSLICDVLLTKNVDLQVVNSELEPTQTTGGVGKPSQLERKQRGFS